MFTKASLRLSAWYVAILMALSVTFSVWVYTEAMNEVRSGLNAQLLRPFANLLPRQEVVNYLDQQYDASRVRVAGSLVLLNIGVLLTGSVVSYFLARRTLQPIEDVLEAQNRFTADASHELRTPLTAMKTEIEVALRDKSLSATEARALLASNSEEIDRLSNLADGLLVLARTSEKPALERVELDDLAAKVVKRLRPLAQKANMTVQLDAVPLAAQAEPSHVERIICILVENAIKYGEPKSTVILALASQDGQACVSVHNIGEPIAAADLPHIFERFYRADASRGKTSGHGLGLAIAQKLAVSIGGTLAAKSDKTGTTFTLRLSRV